MKARDKILLSQFLYAFAVTFSWKMGVPYLMETVGPFWILMASFVAYILSVLFFVLSNLEIRVDVGVFMGTFFRAASLAILGLFNPTWFIMLLSGSISSPVGPLYFVSRGYLLHSRISSESRALFSSLMFSSWVVAGVVGPIVGGFIYLSLGKEALFFSGALVILVSGLLTLGVKDRVRIGFRSILPSRVSRALLVNGMWQGIGYVVPLIVTYTYLHDVGKFGLALSGLAFVGAVASVILGHVSRTLKRRGRVGAAILAVTGVLSVIIGFSRDFWSWIVLLALLNFFAVMREGFLYSIAVDNAKSIDEAINANEFYRSFGNLIGMSVALLILMIGMRIELVYSLVGFLLLVYSLGLWRHYGETRNKNH